MTEEEEEEERAMGGRGFVSWFQAVSWDGWWESPDRPLPPDQAVSCPVFCS